MNEIQTLVRGFYGKITYVKKYRPISLKSVKTHPIARRKSKVSHRSFAGIPAKGDTIRTFMDKLPDILAASDFKGVVKAILKARRNDRPVILGMGAHPIKVGISPMIIDLMQKEIITAVATNGACIVHDFEVSLAGQTSEDVGKELCRGFFGMARETGRGLNFAIKTGIKKGYGIGRSVGEFIYKGEFKYKVKSIFSEGYRLGLPVSVHVAIGTDIIHMHPDADGSAIGEGSFRDFKLFASVVSDLEGGVYINLGSAVIMPEVFLKALAIARNLGHKIENMTTVNMDFIHHYRPIENVLRRPITGKCSSYALTGHHEIMFPLLAAAITEEIG